MAPDFPPAACAHLMLFRPIDIKSNFAAGSKTILYTF